jgi:hypothetical protein
MHRRKLIQSIKAEKVDLYSDYSWCQPMDLKRIESLLNALLRRRETSPELVEELNEYVSDLKDGTLGSSDVRYIEALAKRLNISPEENGNKPKKESDDPPSIRNADSSVIESDQKSIMKPNSDKKGFSGLSSLASGDDEAPPPKQLAAHDKKKDAKSSKKNTAPKKGRTLANPLNAMTEPDDNTSWSEEFQILNEYDPVVKECHDELEGLDHLLSSQFRKEIVSDRKKATEIRDRLKAEHEKNCKALEAELEKKNNPYSSKELNEALAEARLLGQSAEEEFARVIEVMGEDADADQIISRLKDKHGPINLGEQTLEFSTNTATDNEIVQAIEDMGTGKLGINEANRLEGLKIILLGRSLVPRERQSLEFLYNAVKRAVRE